MRLSNRNKCTTYNIVSSVIIFSAIFSIFIYFLDKYELNTFGNKALLFMLISNGLFAIFYIRGRQIFDYDSDGEALNFKNRGVFAIFGRDISDEFPKYKLKKYEVVNAIFFKRLYITISSKKQSTTTLKYEISYLTTKEIRDLKISLNKVLKVNRENPTHFAENK